MDKEKEIQEILNTLITCTEEKDCNTFKFCEPCKARNLYAAGYRKADEVRKETAKALLEVFCNFLNTNLLALMLSDQLGQDYDIEDKWNKFLLKQYEKYGIKVDE